MIPVFLKPYYREGGGEGEGVHYRGKNDYAETRIACGKLAYVC